MIDIEEVKDFLDNASTYTKVKIIDHLQDDIIRYGYVSENEHNWEVGSLEDDVADLERDIVDLNNIINSLEEKNENGMFAETLYDEQKLEILKEIYDECTLVEIQEMFGWIPGSGTAKTIITSSPSIHSGTMIINGIKMVVE